MRIGFLVEGPADLDLLAGYGEIYGSYVVPFRSQAPFSMEHLVKEHRLDLLDLGSSPVRLDPEVQRLWHVRTLHAPRQPGEPPRQRYQRSFALLSPVEADPRYSTTELAVLAAHGDGVYEQPRQKARVEWVAEQCRGHAPNILEIGCCQGYIVDKVGGRAGVDIRGDRLKHAKVIRPHIQFSYAFADSLPFPRDEFEVVLLLEVLEHMREEEALAALREGLRVGRMLVITVPNGDLGGVDVWGNHEHWWAVTKAKLSELSRKAGGEPLVVSDSADGQFILATVRRA